MKYLSILFFFGIISCGNNFTMSIEIPDHEPMIVSTSFISNLDKNIIFVSSSVALNDTLTVNPLEKADVTVENVDSGQKITFDFDESTNSFVNENSNFFESKESYLLTITEERFTSVNSEQKFPAKIEDFNCQFLAGAGSTLNTKPNDLLNISFEKGTKNSTYFLGINYVYQDTMFEILVPDDFDPRLERLDLNSPYPGFLINGNLFQSERIELRFDDRFSTSDGGQLEIKLFHITNDLFLFLDSLNKSKLTEFNNFVEPVSVDFNIENGFGIFGLASGVDTIVIL